MTAIDPTGTPARYFPLVARPRPPCTPIEVRVHGLLSLAHAADRDDNRVAASTVYNQAALLASDLGLPDLARTWCRLHANLYLHAVPLDGPAARFGLEPVVNLARLHIRDGHGQQAFDLLDRLHHAVTTRTDTLVDDVLIPASILTTTDSHQLRRWLWSVHLADGTRALTSVGLWHDALHHLQRHHGIGRRMLDGRQVAVLAHAVEGEHNAARTLLMETLPGEPWENAVTACLTVLCHRPDHPTTGRDLTTLVDHYHHLEASRELAVFDTRLGLAAIDAVAEIDRAAVRHVAGEVVRRAVASGDGYAAREVSAHPRCADHLTPRQCEDLAHNLDVCALGQRTLSATLSQQLSAALEASAKVLTRALSSHRRC